MIAAWMLYAGAVGALSGAAAYGLDRLLRAHRRQSRWVWAGGLALSALWPARAWLARLLPEPSPEGVGAAVEGAGAVVTLAPLTLSVAPDSLLRALDPPLLWLWLAGSVTLAVAAVVVLLRTRALTRTFRRGTIVGRPVMISDRWGPAVVGLLRPTIVLPSWCASLSDEELALVLEHEAQHVEAGDLRLLAAAALACTVFPWNPALWWQLSRLRHTIEADCDLRVVGPGAGREHLRPYLDLLLEVGRRPRADAYAAAMLSEPERTLERRIRIMTAARPRHPVRRALLLAGLTGAALFFACEMPRPTEPKDAPPSEAVAGGASASGAEASAEAPVAPGPTPSKSISEGPVFTPFDTPPRILDREAIDRALRSEYPPLLRDAGVGGTVKVWFLIGATGRVEDVRVRETSGHEAFDAAALRVARRMEFGPAGNRGRAVPVWISMGITFEAR